MMTPEQIDARRKFLMGTKSENIAYTLQLHLSTLLASFSADLDKEKREFLVDAIIKIENAERPNKKFVIDASEFDNDRFRVVRMDGTVGDFHLKSDVAPKSSEPLQKPSETPAPLRSYLGFRRSSGGRRRTKHSKKHSKKSRKTKSRRH